ncbi:MarR family winged helix-turn-helix transcriptional regulator [Nocardioides ultimimeridianus]
MSRGASSSEAVRLRQTEALLRAHLAPLLRERGLTMEHWRILAVVDEEPGIGMSAVATRAVVPAATLTRHADRLVESGLVLRHVDPDDRRRVVVSLSAHGHGYAEQLRAAERRALGLVPTDVDATAG